MAGDSDWNNADFCRIIMYTGVSVYGLSSDEFIRISIFRISNLVKFDLDFAEFDQFNAALGLI